MGTLHSAQSQSHPPQADYSFTPGTMPRQPSYFLFCHQIILLLSSSQGTEPRKKAIEKASLGLLIPSPSVLWGKGEATIQCFLVSSKSTVHRWGQAGPVGSLCLHPLASEGGLQIKMHVLSTYLSFQGTVDSPRPHGLISVISERSMSRANGSKWR